MRIINSKKGSAGQVGRMTVTATSVSDKGKVTFHIYPGSLEYPVEPDILFDKSVVISPRETLRALKSALVENIFSESYAEEDITQKAA